MQGPCKRRRITGKQPAPYRIYVDTPGNKRLTLFVKGSDTVFGLKNMIEQHLAARTDDHLLTLTYRVTGMSRNNVPRYVQDLRSLEDDHTLAHAGVTEASVLKSFHRDLIWIKIYTMSGQETTLEANRNDAIYRIRLPSTVHKRHTDAQYIFGDTILNNDFTLKHYGIQEGAELSVVFMLQSESFIMETLRDDVRGLWTEEDRETYLAIGWGVPPARDTSPARL